MDDQKTHVVTGAFGFTGYYIASRLLAAGQNVFTLTNSPSRQSPLQGKIDARPYDFDNVRKLAQTLEGVDVLYNTYWVRFNYPAATHANAVRNTLTLFEAAHKAGVKRIVHISIANADENSPLEYFSGKGHLETALKTSGLSYSILRPAALFGPGSILINNIAWTLRKFPVFAMFGNGKYHIQPIYVDDLAALAVLQGEKTENTIVPAIGPEDFMYKDFITMIAEAIGHKRPIISIPPALGLIATSVIGKIMGDIFVTKEEVTGLMDDLLHIPNEAPTGSIRISDWVKEHAATLGIRYANELKRHTDLTSAY